MMGKALSQTTGQRYSLADLGWADLGWAGLTENRDKTMMEKELSP
jgi:hypothetical protein